MMASKHSSSSNGAPPPPPSHFNDQGQREQWPVIVYRFQSHRGWEVYTDSDREMSTASTSSSGKKAKSSTKSNSNNGNGRSDKSSSKTPSSHDGAVEELTAAPRVGCIEVRKMRLRIQLFQQHKAWNPNNANEPPRRYNTSNNIGSNTSSTTNSAQGMDNVTGAAANRHESPSDDDFIPDSDGWNNNALLVRRRNTLLISTRRGVGAVMFRFKSTHDCVEFCDRLVYLNREILGVRDNAKVGTTTDGEKGDGIEYVNGLDKREYQQEENVSFKRRKVGLFGDQKVCAPYYDDKQTKYKTHEGNNNDNDSSALHNKHQNGEPSSSAALSQEVKQYQRQEELMNYIVQLAHSEEFRGFVDELERGLEMMGSAEDTSAIPHAALGF